MARLNRKPRIYVRKAYASDKEAVFNFCKKTWSWGDYIQEVWDKWITQEHGKLFVATINRRPVGISHLSIDKSKEVWLSGARTDPNYRRFGVATAITRKCLKYAKRQGASIARLVTDSDNTAAKSLLKKLGFKPVAEFVKMETEQIIDEKSENSKWANTSDLEALWQYLQASEVYRKSAGLYTVLFHWFSLEKSDLKRFVHEQKAITHKDTKNSIDGLMLIDDAPIREWGEKIIQTTYIDGSYIAVLDMAKFLKSYCNKLGIKKINAFACNQKEIVNALLSLNFEFPDSTEIVYEKKIDDN